MLAQQNPPRSHAGEEQSSPDVFAPRNAHWANAAVGLVSAVNSVSGYLQALRDDPSLCIDAVHHRAVVELFTAAERAASAGLTLAGTLQLALGVATSAQYWSVINDRFSAGTLTDVIKNNDWLRVGDYVYQAKTIHRHKLTPEDFAAAGVAVIGSAA